MKRIALCSVLLLVSGVLAFAQADLQPLANIKLNKSESITLKQLKSRVESYKLQTGMASFTVEQKKEILDAMNITILEKEGYEVTYLEVGSNGIVKPEDVLNAIRPDTVLITIMFANNEIGTVQNIPEIGALAHQHGILFHTDAVQAMGKLTEVNVAETPVIIPVNATNLVLAKANVTPAIAPVNSTKASFSPNTIAPT